MRAWMVAAAALAASCAPRDAPESQAAARAEDASSAQAGCARSHTRQVAFSNPQRPDTLTASSQGPTCGQAIVVLALRNADGAPLWAFASPYTGITMLAPEGGRESLTAAQMDEFLGQWGTPTIMRANELPPGRRMSQRSIKSIPEARPITRVFHGNFTKPRARAINRCFA